MCKSRMNSFIKGLATEIYEQGFYNPREKPAAAETGENSHFIIGCCLKSYKQTQRVSFLRDQPGLANKKYYKPDEDFSEPQLIFSARADHSLVVRLEITPPPNGIQRDVWMKVITKEEMFKMLTELANLHMDLYEA
jgi:hypothetical protein